MENTKDFIKKIIAVQTINMLTGRPLLSNMVFIAASEVIDKVAETFLSNQQKTYTSKIPTLLIGKPDSGKTVLKNIIINDEYKSNTEPTLKLKVSDWISPTKNIYSIYDDSGSDDNIEKRETTRKKLHDSNAEKIFYIYVFDASLYEQDNEIKKGIKSAYKEAQNNDRIQMKIIGTRADKLSYDNIENITKDIKNLARLAPIKIFDMTKKPRNAIIKFLFLND